MESALENTDSLVSYLNSRGAPGRGTLLHVTRNIIIFEVYNPYSIVQMSEVLRDLKIVRGERAIYSGRAVVSNLIATGLMLIVSVTPVDAWSDLSGVEPGKGLREEVGLFVKNWDTANRFRSTQVWNEPLPGNAPTLLPRSIRSSLITQPKMPRWPPYLPPLTEKIRSLIPSRDRVSSSPWVGRPAHGRSVPVGAVSVGNSAAISGV